MQTLQSPRSESSVQPDSASRFHAAAFKKLFQFRIGCAASAMVLMLSLVGNARAAAVSWDAGGGANTDWNYNAGTFVNWSGDVTPAANDITFNATGAVSGSSNVTNTLDANYNINSLTVLNTAANYHNFDLNSKTLTVANGISFGYMSGAGVVTTTTNSTMKNGTLTMSAGNFFVGGALDETNGSFATTVDLTSLTALNATGTAFGVGYYGPTNGTGTFGNAALTLSSATNAITVTNLGVGYWSGAGSNSNANNQVNGTLTLKGTTTIKADNIYVAKAKASNSSILTSGTTAVTLNNKAGTGPVSVFTIGGRSYGSSNNVTGKADFSGGSLNGTITTLNLAAGGTTEAGTGTSAGTFITGTSGTLDVTTINMGASGGNTSNPTLDIRGGTFRFDTWSPGSNPGSQQLLLKAGTFSALNSTANTITGLDTFQIGGVGAVTFGQTSVGTGGLTIAATAITLGASTTQTVNVATTLNGTISATTNTMEKLGTGTLTLAGTASNLNTGLVTVSAGSLQLNKTAGLNAIAGSLAIGDGTGGSNTDGVKLLASNQIVDTSAVTINGSSGTLNLNGLSETIGSLADAGTVTPGGSSVALGAGSLTVGDATSTTFSGNITGTGGALTKRGAGTLALEGAGSYTGTTTIAAGTLILSGGGSINTSSQVVVSSVATLTNDTAAALTAPLSLAGNATVDGTGSFTTANLTIVGDLTGATFAAINLNATFSASGSLTFALTNTAPGTYNLFSTTPDSFSFTSVSVGALSLVNSGGTFTANNGLFSYTFVNDTTVLEIASIPEPGTWILVGLGLTFLLYRKPRRLDS